ncbi:MAG: hypothetical protein IOB85_00780 [Methylobacterium sp.]|uniref:hypothetical protein n=1 Tax=Rhabdaerophilum sp. TaxID=2717341 RepID=UPI002A1C8378|nr:hypothetical protein [Rhodobacter sp.]MCA3641321.1 hypothetical protein [Methylobacterium sp.]MCA3645325.1 hypothetical protein [Methylobacterium sp.]MCA3651936.1 hypothetical protein [Methylobacterium sp.]MCA3654594.1 hypothetical protein [Methylobacterium sp.]
MRKRLSIFACLGMMAVAVAIAAGSGSESEARPKPRDFVIAGSDGYGTQDCLASKGDCGRIVADAWCESKGFKAALAYRKLSPDEITGTAGTARNPVDSFLISCRE